MKNINKQAIAEVIEILKHSEKKIKEKIPEKFMQYLYNNTDNQYNVTIDFSKEKWDEEIKLDTKAILALIYRDYIVSDGERNILIQQEQETLKKEEEELREKYNTDNLFKNRKTVEKENSNSNMQLIEVKEETWYKKIWKKIISIFGVK